MTSQHNAWLFLFIAVSIGAMLVTQIGVNAQLRTHLHSPLQTAFISFVVGAIVLGAMCLIQGQPLFKVSSTQSFPFWLWLGGVLGAVYVAGSIFLAPRMGALALSLAVLSGQVMASLVLDQNGWLGYPKLEISWNRVLGLALIIIGVLFVSKR